MWSKINQRQTVLSVRCDVIVNRSSVIPQEQCCRNTVTGNTGNIAFRILGILQWDLAFASSLAKESDAAAL